ncbi:MAG: hypothetical protein NTY35_14700 [Planctomycetota bacterium]|nr:hypothetical protein [Planctomycetota bacterium]
MNLLSGAEFRDGSEKLLRIAGSGPARWPARAPDLRERVYASRDGQTPEDFLLALADRMRPARTKPRRRLILLEEPQASPGLSWTLGQQRG